MHPQHAVHSSPMWWTAILHEICSNPRTGTIRMPYRMKKQTNRLRIGQVLELKDNRYGEILGIQGVTLRLRMYRTTTNLNMARRRQTRHGRSQLINITPTNTISYTTVDNVLRDRPFSRIQGHPGEKRLIPTTVHGRSFHITTVSDPPRTTDLAPEVEPPQTHQQILISQAITSIDNQTGTVTIQIKQMGGTICKKKYKYNNECRAKLHPIRMDLIATHQALRILTNIGHKHNIKTAIHFTCREETSQIIQRFKTLSTLRQTRTHNEDILYSIQRQLEQVKSVIQHVEIKGQCPTELSTIKETTKPPKKNYVPDNNYPTLKHQHQTLVHDPRRQLKEIVQEEQWQQYLQTHDNWNNWMKVADL